MIEYPSVGKTDLNPVRPNSPTILGKTNRAEKHYALRVSKSLYVSEVFTRGAARLRWPRFIAFKLRL